VPVEVFQPVGLAFVSFTVKEKVLLFLKKCVYYKRVSIHISHNIQELILTSYKISSGMYIFI